MELLKNKKFVLSLILLLAIGTSFWFGSRYPALNEKALMGGNPGGIEPLGFDRVIRIDQDEPVYLKVIYTTINWSDTNKRGMAFGVLFAAAILTLISLFGRKSFEGSFSNSLLGVLVGTPLGVCVNCAAPIAKGMHSAGTRLETTLAAMISSPTLNIIIITMLFSLFPFYIAALKIGTTILFLILILPLLSKFFFKKEIELSSNFNSDKLQPGLKPIIDINDSKNVQTDNSFVTSLKWLVINFSKNLWYIIKKTVPLMILAGLLGAVVITLLPWDSFVHVIPGSGRTVALLVMFFFGVVGIFLPVPIAFDVIIVSILMSAGLPVKYAMVLLFTLGIFSVYSFFIVTQSISFKVASVLTLVFIFLGMSNGLAARVYEKFEQKRNIQIVIESLSEAPGQGTKIPGFTKPAAKPLNELKKQIEEQKLVFKKIENSGDKNISIEYTEFKRAQSGSGKLFEKYEGSLININRNYIISPLHFLPPFRNLLSISTGDIHKDGWVDVLLTADFEVSLYSNIKGKFVEQLIDVPLIDSLKIANSVLVDLNNDGWLDIHISTYMDGNYIIYSDKGEFNLRGFKTVPIDKETIVSIAPAFGDLDKDGDLDIVLGNWGLGVLNMWWTSPAIKNYWLENADNGFLIHLFPCINGETLTTLITDINDDNNNDVIFGNDFEVPDMFHLGKDNAEFRLLKSQEELVPFSTQTTMSITSADINNDIIPELYFGQIARNREKLVEINYFNEFSNSEIKEYSKYYTELFSIFTSSFLTRNPERLLQIQNQYDRQASFIIYMLYDRAHRKMFNLNEYLKSNWKEVYSLSEQLKIFENSNEYKMTEDSININSIMGNNILFELNNKGKYEDIAEKYNLHKGGWTWNAKFADVDNDTWQDIYIANGLVGNLENREESNYFFKNQKGETFIDFTDNSGLSSYRETAAYSYIDVDIDGDLDIIAVPFVGPIMYFENQSNENRSIMFELNDNIGNHFGIGSKLIIHYANGLHQMREVFASGGFESFDAPILHFGLGKHELVNKVEVIWSTGEKTVIEKEFIAGRIYRVIREFQNKNIN